MRPENLGKWIEHLEAQPSDLLDRRIDALLHSQPVVVRKRTAPNRIAGAALAAAVLLAVLIGMPLFHNGHNGNVWARALENTRRIDNYSFRRTMIQRSSDPAQPGDKVREAATWYVSAEHGPYVEHHAGGEYDYAYVSYEVRDSNEWITIYPATQEYERRPCIAPSDFTPPPRETALWLLGSDYVELGTKTVDGRVLTGIANRGIPERMSDDVAQWHEEIWFDVETMLPAGFHRVVVSKTSGESYITRQDQFRYNVEFPPHVFERSIPEGYTLTVVNGLRLFAELVGGKYPWSMDEPTIRHDLGDRTAVQQALERLAPPSGRYGYDGLLRGARFFEQFVRQSPDHGYFANRVTPKDGNLVLMYWGDPKRSYQVVWGDLRAETLSRDELIQSCHIARDPGCLLDLLEKDDGTTIPLLCAHLGAVGDRSVVPALLRHADLQADSPTADLFTTAFEAIRQREEQRNPSSALVAGRLLYANGRSVSRGCVHVGTTRASADRHGYFAILAPRGAPHIEQVGYAHRLSGANARLFRWAKARAPACLTIVLDWTSTVAGRVVNRAGGPLAGIDVGLCPHPGGTAGQDWPDGDRTRTDAQGRFLFEDVPIGIPLELVIENPDVAAGPLRVRIDDLEPDRNRDLGDLVIRSPEE